MCIRDRRARVRHRGARAAAAAAVAAREAQQHHVAEAQADVREAEEVERERAQRGRAALGVERFGFLARAGRRRPRFDERRYVPREQRDRARDRREPERVPAGLAAQAGATPVRGRSSGRCSCLSPASRSAASARSSPATPEAP